MAEVYWDLEWTLQQQGFDYTYDKRLYDRLREGHARPVREHLYAGLDYQVKLARFLENHDDPAPEQRRGGLFAGGLLLRLRGKSVLIKQEKVTSLQNDRGMMNNPDMTVGRARLSRAPTPA